MEPLIGAMKKDYRTHSRGDYAKSSRICDVFATGDFAAIGDMIGGVAGKVGELAK